jgi:hypothetical protein
VKRSSRACVRFVERKQANMKSSILIAAAIVALAMPAAAQTRSFYNGNGSFAGSSVTRGNSSSFYNGSGSFAGSSVRHRVVATAIEEPVLVAAGVAIISDDVTRRRAFRSYTCRMERTVGQKTSFLRDERTSKRQ